MSDVKCNNKYYINLTPIIIKMYVWTHKKQYKKHCLFYFLIYFIKENDNYYLKYLFYFYYLFIIQN